MRALVLSEGYNLSIKETIIPRIGNNEVLVKVQAVGICGSDVHGYDGSTGRRIPPIIMGHELSGIIEKTTKNSSFQVGDHVTAHSTIYCGKCIECKNKNFSICNNRKVIGVSCKEFKQDGAMSDYIALPEHIVYKIPKNVSFEEAAMAEPCSVALHAISKIEISKRKNILVFGCGTIGLLIVHTLKIKGYKNIISVDKVQARLDKAIEMGAKESILWDKTMQNSDFTDNILLNNIDCIVDAVGTSETLNASINIINNGGFIRLVGNISNEIKFPLQDVVSKEIKLIGSYAFCSEFSECLIMMQQKKINVKPILSKIIKLEDAPYWFKKLASGDSEIIKVIIKP